MACVVLSMPPLDGQPVTLTLALLTGACTLAFLATDSTQAFMLAAFMGIVTGLSYTPDISEYT